MLVLCCFAAGCGDVTVIETPSSTSASTSETPATTSDTVAPTSSTEAAFVQQEGEIFLEPSGVAGPESFVGEQFIPAGPTTTFSIPTSSTLLPEVTTTTAPGVQGVISYMGDTPALYGGSKSKARCDKEGQLRFLEQNPDKAAAFCAALNSDPNLRWSGGTQVRPDQLSDYFAELTPTILTRDTRVTNHGYRDGQPTPRQSVLQAGQAVLVDRYGVPRVRCECGNPLIPPKPVRTTPRYTGPRWPDFDPTVIIVIQQTTVVIDVFVLVDIVTGGLFDRPAGTTGTEDAPHETSVWQLTVDMFWDDQKNQDQITVTWSAEIAVNPDGTLSGVGGGKWHIDGACFSDRQVNGYVQADGSLSVNISGRKEVTELGPTLMIQPAMGDFSIDSQVWDPPTGLEECRADFEAGVAEWVQASFADLELAANDGPTLAQVVAAPYQGSATLTPLR